MEVYMAKHGGKVPGYVVGALVPAAVTAARFVAPYVARTFGGAKRIKEAAAASPTFQKIALVPEAATAAYGGGELYAAATDQNAPFSDRPATFFGGLSGLYGGLGYGGRSLKTAFPTSPTAKKIGEKLSLPAPFLIPLGGVGLASVEGEAVPFYKKESGIRSDTPEEFEKKMDTLNKEFAKLNTKKNVTKEDYLNVVENSNLSENQKQTVFTEIFGIDRQTAQALKTTTPLTGSVEVATAKQKFDLGISDNPIESNFMQNMANGSPSKMSTGGQNQAALDLLKKQESANAQIKQIEKDKEDDAAWKSEYTKLRNSILNVTGNSDMTNLVLMQLAAGLLTGKTRQGGLSGFADVLGQASKPAIETAVLLAVKQKEFDNELALSLLKNRAAGSPTKKIEEKRVYVLETDPNDKFYPQKTKQVGISSETRQLIEITPGPQGEQFTLYTGTGPIQPVSEKEYNKALTQMDEQKRVIQYANFVLDLDQRFLGAGGTLKNYYNDITGAALSAFNAPTVSDFDKTSFEQIRSILYNPEFYGEQSFLTKDEKETAIKERDKIYNEFIKADEKYTKNLRKAEASKDQEKLAFATLEFIQNRAKYIVANANKAQDRLTAKDITEAEKNTKIFGLKDPAKIKSLYEALRADTNNRFKDTSQRYIKNMGTIDDLKQNYSSVPYVQGFIKQENKKIRKEAYGTPTGSNVKKRDLISDLNNFDNL